MKASRFSEEQIIAILREQEAGQRTADVCRRHGVSEATFYKWKSKYGGRHEVQRPALVRSFRRGSSACVFLTPTCACPGGAPAIPLPGTGGQASCGLCAAPPGPPQLLSHIAYVEALEKRMELIFE